MISPEDLLISKMIWIQQLKSEKQVNDIHMLLRLDELDMTYIRTWLNKLDLKTYDLL
jgi:hypothetical protein